MSEFTERFKRPGLVAIALAGGIALGGCGASSEAAPEETPTVTEQKVTTVDTFEVDSETTVTFFSSGSAEIKTRNYGEDYLSIGTMPVFLTCIGDMLLTSPQSYYGDTGSGATITANPICADGTLTREDFELAE